ncbi:MAG: Maf family protein [Candidatus Asgardarchaeia archaeon]
MVKKLILGSSSPRRIFILKAIGFNLEVRKPNVSEEEIISKINDPIELVTRLSSEKAHSVWRGGDKTLIVAADTIVYVDGKLLGKPNDVNDAINMLRMLSGREHAVYTGFTIIDTKNNKAISDYDVTKVKFRELSEREIQWYISTKEPFGKAGAYAIQGRVAVFVERITGDFFNVVGFPVAKFVKRLTVEGYSIYDYLK